MLLWEAVSGKKTQSSQANKAPKPIITTRRLRSVQPDDRCTATTRIGRRCRCRRARDSQFCNFHDPEISARIRAKARATREERKQQLANLPEGYLKSLNSSDGIASALDNLYREVRLGVISPRTATVMLAIIDRLLVYEKLVADNGKRRVNRKQRAQEIRQQLAAVMDELKLPAPVRPVKAAVSSPNQNQQRPIQNLTAG
jgi:hypothetical protein